MDNKEQYEKFHRKVKTLGIVTLVMVAVTVIFLFVALNFYKRSALLLMIGLPTFLSLDVTLVVLVYMFNRKDKRMRRGVDSDVVVPGASPLFTEIYRDYKRTRLESVWDSVTPNGWKFVDAYEVEDSIELVIAKKPLGKDKKSDCSITLQFGKTEVTVFFTDKYGDKYISKELNSTNFPDLGTLVIWLSRICQKFADSAEQSTK